MPERQYQRRKPSKSKTLQHVQPHCTYLDGPQRDPADEMLRNTARWKKLRRWQLLRYPLCCICGKPARMAHHITIPHGDLDLFFSGDNLASVCYACHGKIHGAYKRGISWDMLTTKTE